MADDPTTSPPADPPANDDAETKFWSKLGDEMGKLIDAKFAARDEARKKNPPADLGTNRTGAQPVSLKGWIADLVYGPKKG